MRSMPTLFQSIEVRAGGKTVGEESAEGGAPFPVPTFPTAHLFVKMGFTRNDGRYNFHKHDCGLSIPFDQNDLDGVYAKVKAFVSAQLLEIDGSRRLNEAHPFSTDIVVVKDVPAGATISVPYSTGRTVSLPNMESARIDVGLTLLSDPAKAMDALRFAHEWCEGTIEAVVSKIKAAMC